MPAVSVDIRESERMDFSDVGQVVAMVLGAAAVEKGGV